MRVGLLGGGVIARLFLEQRGDAEIVAIAGRSEASRGKALAREFGVPFVEGPLDETVWADVPGGGLLFDRYPLPRTVAGADEV